MDEGLSMISPIFSVPCILMLVLVLLFHAGPRRWTTVETSSTCGATQEIYCILTGAGKKEKMDRFEALSNKPICLGSVDGEDVSDQDCGICDSEKHHFSHPIAFVTDGTERWWKSENYIHEVNITMSLGQTLLIWPTMVRLCWAFMPIHLNLLKNRPGAETFYSNEKLKRGYILITRGEGDVLYHLFSHSFPCKEMNVIHYDRVICLDLGLDTEYVFAMDIQILVSEILTLVNRNVDVFIILVARLALNAVLDSTNWLGNLQQLLQTTLHRTTGINCEKCMPGYYRPEKQSHYDWDACQKCECNINGSTSNICDGVDGKCKCKKGVAGLFCDRCQTGLWNFPKCEECKCNNLGSYSGQCDPVDGLCRCKPGVKGPQCQICNSVSKKYPGVSFLTNIGCLPCSVCSITLLNDSINLINHTTKVNNDLNTYKVEDFYILAISRIWQALWHQQDQLASMKNGSQVIVDEVKMYSSKIAIEVEETNLVYMDIFLDKINLRTMMIEFVPTNTLNQATELSLLLENVFSTIRDNTDILNSIAINRTKHSITKVKNMGRYAISNMKDMLDWDKMWSKVLMERKYAEIDLDLIKRKHLILPTVKEKIKCFKSKLNTVLPSFQHYFDLILNNTEKVFGLKESLILKLSIVNSMHFSIEKVYQASKPIFRNIERSSTLNAKTFYSAKETKDLMEHADELLLIYVNGFDKSGRENSVLKKMVQMSVNNSKNLQAIGSYVKTNFTESITNTKQAVSSLDIFQEIVELLKGSVNLSKESSEIIDRLYEIDMSKNYTMVSLILKELALKFASNVNDLQKRVNKYQAETRPRFEPNTNSTR
ncbi:Laminin subunit gamma-1 [Nymphon striatum]|nr:Laminin subunit gamma-1 [Nymphon striatum]